MLLRYLVFCIFLVREIWFLSGKSRRILKLCRWPLWNMCCMPGGLHVLFAKAECKHLVWEDKRRLWSRFINFLIAQYKCVWYEGNGQLIIKKNTMKSRENGTDNRFSLEFRPSLDIKFECFNLVLWNATSEPGLSRPKFWNKTVLPIFVWEYLVCTMYLVQK